MMLVNTSGSFNRTQLPALAEMYLQLIIGLFLTIVVVARTLGMLPTSQATTPYLKGAHGRGEPD
jgi:hypothetical protein